MSVYGAKGKTKIERSWEKYIVTWIEREMREGRKEVLSGQYIYTHTHIHMSNHPLRRAVFANDMHRYDRYL